MTCPSCGQAIGFKTERAPYAVCPSCSTLVVRKDVNLEVIGIVGECQPDSSPLQLGVTGSHEGRRFEVIGRIQVSYGAGFWNEWFLRYSDGEHGWLGDALGQYFLSQEVDMPPSSPLRAPAQLALGAQVSFGGKLYVALDRKTIQISSMEGELGRFQEPRTKYLSTDFRCADGGGLTVDLSGPEPALYQGRYVRFADLELQGLRHGEDTSVSVPRELVKAVQCPGCGAPHELSTGPQSQLLVCQYCGSTNDSSGEQLRQVAGAVNKARELAQSAAIPLGSEAHLEEATYKVIGFVVQGTRYEGILYTWTEYLLFNHLTGYRWLSESDGHFTLFEQLEGLPTYEGSVVGTPPERGIDYRGRTYRHFQTSRSELQKVVGEFYWRPQVGEKSQNFDFVDPPEMLSAAFGATDITWSVGRYLEREELAKTFPEVSAFPSTRGVGPNQPNPYLGILGPMTGLAAAALAIAFLIILSEVFLPEETRLFEARSIPVPSKDGSWRVLRKTFDMPHGRDLRLHITSDLQERWADLTLKVGRTNSGLRTREVGLVNLNGQSRLESDIVIPQTFHWGKGIVRLEAATGPPLENVPLRRLEDAEPVPALFHVSIEGYAAKPSPGWGALVLMLFLVFLPHLRVARQKNRFEQQRWYASDYG